MFRSIMTATVSVALLLFAGASVAAATPPSKAPIKIAFIDPLSGPMADVGQPEIDTFKFSAELINKQGGIDGHPVQIVPMDNKLSVKQTIVQLNNAINQGIHYVTLGDGDPFAAAIIHTLDRHNRVDPKDRVVYLNYAAIGPQFVNKDCSFWQFLFDANNDMKMDILTSYIKTRKDIHKVYLLDQNYGFGRRVAEDAVKDLKKKRPDIKIVGNVFVPLAKVKDFTPYVIQIKASGADALITGNWGSDLIRLVKAVESTGLKIPIFTYYSNQPGTVAQLGKGGVGLLYVVDAMPGDYTNPELAKREVEMKKQSGYDYVFLRITYELEMLKKAAEKAHSINPTKVAFAMEGLKMDGPFGPLYMRAENHQVEMPMFVSVLSDHMKYGADNSKDLNFRQVAKFPANESVLPTTCKMKRPARPN